VNVTALVNTAPKAEITCSNTVPGGAPYSSRNAGRVALAVGAVALALYLLTLCPVASWGDSAKLVMLAADPQLDVDAGRHLLHNYLGYLFSKLPLGTLAVRINFMSAFFGAATVALCFAIVLRLTTCFGAAIAAASALAVSHIFWHVSVIAESYTLLFFLMALQLYLLVVHDETRRFAPLLAAAFLFGLSVTASLAVAAIVPALAAYLLMHRRALNVRRVLLLIGAAALGTAPLACAFCVRLSDTPVEELVGTMLALRYSGGLSIFHPFEALKGILFFAAFLFYQFPVLGSAAGLAGVRAGLMRKRRIAVVVLLSLGVFVLLTAGYKMQRRWAMMSGAFFFFSILIGLGAAWALERWEWVRRRRGALLAAMAGLPVALYAVAPSLLELGGYHLVPARAIPYRDNVQYYMAPWKHNDDGPRRFAEASLATAEDGTILADFTPFAVLEYYRRYEASAPNVKLVFTESVSLRDFVRENADTDTLYIVMREQAEQLKATGLPIAIEACGPLYRIRRGAPGPSFPAEHEEER
jgi:hypothetical protein